MYFTCHISRRLLAVCSRHVLMMHELGHGQPSKHATIYLRSRSALSPKRDKGSHATPAMLYFSAVAQSSDELLIEPSEKTCEPMATKLWQQQKPQTPPHSREFVVHQQLRHSVAPCCAFVHLAYLACSRRRRRSQRSARPQARAYRRSGRGGGNRTSRYGPQS